MKIFFKILLLVVIFIFFGFQNSEAKCMSKITYFLYNQMDCISLKIILPEKKGFYHDCTGDYITTYTKPETVHKSVNDFVVNSTISRKKLLQPSLVCEGSDEYRRIAEEAGFEE